MPTDIERKAAVQAYVDGYNAGDAEAILALFADDAVVEDPLGSPVKRRAEFEAFFRQGVTWGAQLTLAAPIRGSHGNAAAMAFTVEFVQDGRPVRIDSLDVMEFGADGKIVRMTGYWGPGDVVGG